MNLIWLLLKESWITVAIAVLTGLVSGSCSARLIVLINNTISGHLTTNIMWYFGGLAGLALVTGTISQFLLIDLAQGAISKLRLRLSARILSAPLQQLEELGANRLLVTLTEDVQSISNSVFVIPFMCIDIAILGGCFIYLAWLSGVTFVVILILGILAIYAIQILLKKAGIFLEIIREEYDQLYQNLRAITDGTKELKLHHLRRQEFFSKELELSTNKIRNLKSQSLRRFALAFGGGQFLLFTILGVLIFILPRLIYIKQDILVQYVLTMTFLVIPVQNFLDKLPILITASVSLNKIEQMGLKLADKAEKTYLQNTHQDYSQTNKWKNLELNNIIHKYQGDQEDMQFILGELNLILSHGQLVFIIGGNGSGKSTLAKIITGLYIPEKGEIIFDNIAITDDNREWYRQHFSAIFSDVYLFDSLLGTNSNSLNTQIEKYIKQLDLKDKVKVQNGKFSTTKLSQGQRKRLALLIAYLDDRPIYLFDEWASDQDPFFRDIFYHQLLPELKNRGKTVIVISHDDRYYHVADRIIKLDYGKIESDSIIA